MSVPARQLAHPTTAHEPLVAAVAGALGYYLVEREACGLRDTQKVLRELDVPREEELRTGMRTR